MATDQENFVQFEVGERIFLCSLKTLQKYPNSTLAKCLKHCGSDKKVDTTITLECDPECFQWILDYMRDGRLDKMDSLSRHEVRQLSMEAKYFCLDGLVELCVSRIKKHFMGHGCLGPRIIASRFELEEVLKQARRTGDFTVLLNVEKLDREKIAELTKLGPRHKFKLLSCHGKVTAYHSELYKAGNLIVCSDHADDLLSYIYYFYHGVFL